ncbi:ice-binding family protein [Paraburkholderia sp. GAS348]|uniref:ice-binding family protein n=1 Tax=Paraburkholderia sp. GAS348 TaxID=3035132 RepID=UPI003D236CEF
MNHFQKHLAAWLVALVALLSISSWARAQTVPGLGTASAFAVLSAAPGGAGAVTCTNSTISGAVGSTGAPASVVQTTCTITGAVTAPVPAQVVSDFNTAYGNYAAIPCTGVLTGTTQTLTPGVYCSTGAVTFTSATLTLDGQGNPNAVWIFKVGTAGSGALTGTNFSVVMINSGAACNVNWWVADAATLTTSAFQGNILAGAGITFSGAGSTPTTGNDLAKGAVTLTGVTETSCQAVPCQEPDKSYGKFLAPLNILSHPWDPMPQCPQKCKLPLPTKSW